MLSQTTINLKIYNMVGIRHFAKLAETSEGSASKQLQRISYTCSNWTRKKGE